MNKLGLMEEIYAFTKIEPRLWYDPETKVYCAKKQNKTVLRQCSSGLDMVISQEFLSPYYPLEQVLDHLGGVQGAYKEISNSQECKHLTALKIWYYALKGSTDE